MSSLFWNPRGLEDFDKRRFIKDDVADMGWILYIFRKLRGKISQIPGSVVLVVGLLPFVFGNLPGVHLGGSLWGSEMINMM
jgi:hypothetical protein